MRFFHSEGTANSMPHRQKISTTISAESYAYLRKLIQSRRAKSLAEAVDMVVLRHRRADNRRRLERDTAAYFERLSSKDAAEEFRLEKTLVQMTDEIDLDS